MKKRFLNHFIFGLCTICIGFCQTKNGQDSTQFDSELTLMSQYLDSAEWKPAKRALKRYLKQNPESVSGLKLQARYYDLIQEPEMALKTWNTIRNLIPEDYESLKYSAILWYKLGDFKRSFNGIDSACKISENEHIKDPDVFYYRALLNRKKNNLNNILLDCEMAEDMDSTYIPSHLLKAEIRFERQQYELSVKEYDIVLQLMSVSDTDFSVLKNRAKALYENGQVIRAALDWTIYLRKYPDQEEALISRASALIRGGRFKEAIVDLDDALKKNPKNSVIYDYRGTAKAEMGLFKEGLQDLDHAIQLKFNYAPHYVNRAAIKLALKQSNEACEDLEKAEQLGSNVAYKYIQRYCRKN